MRRLRPLSEAECYVRLYGDGEGNVAIVAVQRPAKQAALGLSGEALRRIVEQRLDAREADAVESEAT